MTRQDRRNAIIVATIAAIAAIVGALISSGAFKKETTSAPQPIKIENRAETKGDQSPAITGRAKDVTITYGNPAGSPGKKR